MMDMVICIMGALTMEIPTIMYIWLYRVEMTLIHGVTENISQDWNI